MHEHEWVTMRWDGYILETLVMCESCDVELFCHEIEEVLNNPTVKTMINLLIARRDDEDTDATPNA